MTHRGRPGLQLPKNRVRDPPLQASGYAKELGRLHQVSNAGVL